MRLCCSAAHNKFELSCDRELGKGRGTALECVRVAYAMDGLPRQRVLIGAGGPSRERMRAITRFATVETEFAWIDLALEGSPCTLPTTMAQSTTPDLDTPPPKGFRVPDVRGTWSSRFAPEEVHRLETALAVASEPEEGDPRLARIRLADAVLSGAMRVGRESTNGRSATTQGIPYRTCPACRTTADTSDGPVAVGPDRVEEPPLAADPPLHPPRPSPRRVRARQAHGRPEARPSGPPTWSPGPA